MSFFRAGVISLTSNIVVLLMFGKFKELRTATNFIIINLAFTDIGVAAIGYPMSAASDIHGSWKFGHTGCQVSGKTLQRFVIIGSHAHAGFSWDKRVLDKPVIAHTPLVNVLCRVGAHG